MWLFYALLSALLIGLGQVVTKKGLSHIPPLYNNILSVVVTAVIIIPYILFHPVHFTVFWTIYPYAFLIAACYICYYYILELGIVSLTSSVLAIYPLFTIMLSIFFLHEKPDIFQTIAIILVITGAVIIAFPAEKNAFKKMTIGAWFWWALFGAAITGFADFFTKVTLNKSDFPTYIFAYLCAWIPVVFISIIFDKKSKKLPRFNLEKYLPTIIGVSLLESSFFVFSIALSQGYASLVTAISSLYVGITAVFAWIFLKEKISKLQLIGILSSLAGIILISF